MKPLQDRETDPRTLDDAARAAWLYYVGGHTQDQIARALGISRQRAQRLVSKAVAEGLIHVRLDHPVARCMELQSALAERYGLREARVALALGSSGDPLVSLAPLAAAELERILGSVRPITLALGTGRSLRAMVERLPRIDAGHHKVVSLTGNVAPDGSATFFEVIMRIADKTGARHYPMPLPVIAETEAERAMLHRLAPVAHARALAAAADVTLVGIGQMTASAPLLRDGFLTETDLAEMQAAGAAGEIAGWIFDAGGRYLDRGSNRRVAGVRVDPGSARSVIAVAAGAEKLPALRAALAGRLINGLYTDEATAEALLD